MSTPITIGLGILGAGLGGRVLWQALRGGASVGAANFAVGGFQGKMDKGEAMKVLGIKYVHVKEAHSCCRS
jgi:DnaJ family protein C protein 19